MNAGGNGSITGRHAYQEYWEAPSKYWNGRLKTVSEEEIDAVLVSDLKPTPFPYSQILSRAEEQLCIRLYRHLVLMATLQFTSLQSFSAYASKCLSTSDSSITRHCPLRSGLSSPQSETIPISTSPALKSVACTVEIASMAIWDSQM
jgi:hypothetical protein